MSRSRYGVSRSFLFVGAMIFALLASGAAQAASDELSFERRVAAQRAIEQVYWEQRTWPASEAKPPLDQLLSDEAIRDKVRDTLRKSSALEVVWKRPVAARQLQAELDRMVSQTRAPETLARLFAALDNDPRLIAETLARQVLVNRLARDWYALDAGLHADTHERAKQALAASTSVEDWIALGGVRQRSVWVLDSGAQVEADASHSEIVLDREQWAEQTSRLAERVGSALPLGGFGELAEESDAFEVIAVTASEPGRLEVTTVRWPKQGFDEWWSDQQSAMAIDIDVTTGPYSAGSPQGAAGCASNSWSNLTGVPQGRVAHTAVWTGSEMIVWGGGFGLVAGSVATNHGGRYDPATNTWSPVSTTGAASPRRQHTAVWNGQAMIVWGGREDGANSGLSTATGGLYDPTTDSWSATSMVGAPAAREDHTAVIVAGELIVWGGRDHLGATFGDGGRYDPSTDSWSALSMTDAPVARNRHSAVSTGSTMIVWGGSDASFSYLNSGAVYSPAGDSWTATDSTAAPSGRNGHTAIWSGSEMIVWGGIGPSPTNSGGRFDPASNSWSPTQVAGSPDPRKAHSAVWTGSEMIVWGGDAGTTEFRTGGLYDPFADSWNDTALAGPAARANHTAVWTGDEMIVWGGATKNTTQAAIYLDSGGRYDPSSNQWVSTPESGNPVRRAFHSTVWTGAEMIVWGGFYYGDGYHHSGGIFDPATSSWTPTSDLGAPDGRRNHTAVWTGSEMIVWGGYSVNTEVGVVFYKTGGRYDPIADSWTPTTTIGTPQKRQSHTAVWTGNEMIVFGGGGYSGFVITHGRYSPATDSWSPVSSVGVPEYRYKHTGVWTGDRMLIWGGGSENLPQNTGALYDPVGDSWTPMSEDDAPGRRLQHASAWTGDKLIVWGGKDEVTDLADGAIYDPASDSWTAISTAGALSARHNMGHVWTGTNLIVWGGRQGTNYEYNDGAIYNPTADDWSPMAQELVPDQRSEFSAIWTGDEMLLFGGEKHPNGFWGDGARFCVTDSDGDGAADNFDCNPDDASSWDDPGDVQHLSLNGAGMTAISWDGPVQQGATGVVYDVLRTTVASEFDSADCVASDVSDPWAADGDMPSPGVVFFYLIKVENGCGSALGEGSDGIPRGAGDCG